MKNFLTCLCALFSASSFAVSQGTLCLTFDDIFLESWEKAIPFFQKYDARVTFFIYGKIDDKTVISLKKLQKAGHTIGLHGLTHSKAAEYLEKQGAEAYMKNEIMPQLEVCRKNNINVRAFAYPYSQRNPQTDKLLFREFDFLRSSHLNVSKKGIPLATINQCFVKKPGKKQLFYGFPASGKFNLDEVKAAMKRAADEKAVLVFYAHNITEQIPPSHHIAFSQLEQILEYAKTIGLAVKGLNEL